MINLFKANIKRITKNIIFIGGCIIAFFATLAFTANMTGEKGRLDNYGPDGRMQLISIAMVIFFTIFVPLYTNLEYRYGVIRNKIVAGYSQKQVYFSHLLGHLCALAIMMASYLLGGILGGARDFGKMVVLNSVFFFSLSGYIAIMMFISFRIRKIIPLCIAAYFIMQSFSTVTMLGNFLTSFILKGTAEKVGIIIYNMNPFGQWTSGSAFSYDFNNPGRLLQIAISVAVMLVMIFFGTNRLEKRDLT